MSRTRYSSAPQTIYVDYVQGSNSNSGTANSPYKNLQCALEQRLDSTAGEDLEMAAKALSRLPSIQPFSASLLENS